MQQTTIQFLVEILKILEKQLSEEEPNWKAYSAETLCISTHYWARLLTMLEEEKLTKGFNFTVNEKTNIVSINSLGRITLKGLEWLENNK